MTLRNLVFLAASVLLLLDAHAQPAVHPGAEKALARIVIERDFGDELKFHSREAVTFAENDRVRGLNGLMFVRWKGPDPATEVVASVQWFEDTSDLLRFYRAEKARTARGLRPIGDTVIWKTGDASFTWTDGKHFVVSLGGSPAPGQEMLEAWLALIESHPIDLAPLPKPSPKPSP